ncbi:MAG: hypothetical protein C4278_00005 [Patescibacteria group bacterium]
MIMGKVPKIRIIGTASPKEKKKVKEEIRLALFEHFKSLSEEEKKMFKKFEYPKSEIELALINFANKITNELMKEAGVEPYDIPPENYHILPPELYKRLASDLYVAQASRTKQRILFNAEYFRDNPVYFGAVVFHETLHLKTPLCIKVNKKDNKTERTLYRVSVCIYHLERYPFYNKSHIHFCGLEEAIISKAEKNFLPRLLELPELVKEKEWLMSKEAKKLKKKLAKKEGIPEEDIIWVGKKREDGWIALFYRPQIEVLNYVCSEIQQEFSGQFQTADDVFKLFLKAHFTGNLLTIKRLVEKTFGKRSFLVLGNMTTDHESGVLHLETLKVFRRDQISQKT